MTTSLLAYSTADIEQHKTLINSMKMNSNNSKSKNKNNSSNNSRKDQSDDNITFDEIYSSNISGFIHV